MGVNDTSEAAKIISTEQDLFVWLFRQLDVAPPQVSVDRSVESSKGLFLAGVLEGGLFWAVPVDWQKIMSSIQPAEMHARNEFRYGLKLLMIMRYFNEALDRLCGSKIPLMTAIEVMRDKFDPSREYLRHGYAGERCWLESTPECTKKYGLRVRVALPKEPNCDSP